MEAEFTKDLRHNYMVLTEEENVKTEAYCKKMIEYQQITGILSMEQKRVDDKVLLFYDITSKQSLNLILEKTALTYGRVKQLFNGIIEAVGNSYEYLLMEDDFILLPEFIFQDIVINAPYLCYYSGYRKNILEQTKDLLEYLMNKVDYNDKDAVLLVYQLYAVSREEGFTFEHLQKVLQKQPEELIPDKRMNQRSERSEERAQEHNSQIRLVPERSPLKEQTGPVMLEKLEDEEEVDCYPFKTYLITGGLAIAGMILMIASFSTKLFYNTYGDRINYSKLVALFLIVVCVEGYLLNKLWDKSKKQTKIVLRKRYIDPRLEDTRRPYFIKSKEHTPLKPTIISADIPPSGIKEVLPSCPSKALFESIGDRLDNNTEEDNPTCLLNASVEAETLILKPLEEKDNAIIIKEFPFFIGKLKENVDYCLDKEVVSRYHAKITLEQGRYLITDLNSKNGTFLNQEPVPIYEYKELQIGDEIAFANIKYLVEKR